MNYIFTVAIAVIIGLLNVPVTMAIIPETEALKVLRITPQGDSVPAGQQLVIQFDRPVVTIGAMQRDERDVPVTISPAVNCEWRWLNTSALACQLAQKDKLRMATSYEVVVHAEMKTVAGENLTAPFIHRFTTVRPQLTYTRFMTWVTPSVPLLQVSFNQPVLHESVEKALIFNVKISDAEKLIGLKAYPDAQQRIRHWQQTELYPSQDNLKHSIAKPGNDHPLESNDWKTPRRIWYVEPISELPEASEAQLKITPGLQAEGGPALGNENRVVVSFDTYPSFQFVGLRCTPKGQREHQILYHTTYSARTDGVLSADGDEIIAGPSCAPRKPVALVFTAPVLSSVVKRFAELTPELTDGRMNYDPWANTHDWSSLGSPHRKGRYYYVWLPESLRAKTAYSLNLDGDALVDEFNRPLGTDVSFQFHTSHREPRLHIRHKAAVLEQDIDSDVPLMVTNLNSVEVEYQRLTTQQRQENLSQSVALPSVKDKAFTHPLGARDLVKDSSGAVFGQLHPDPLPVDYRQARELFVQISPFQVHTKLGHFNSLVWVTRFADGQPVNNAKVTLFKGTYRELTELAELSFSATTDGSGQARLPGTNEIDPLLQLTNSWRNKPRLFIKVEQGEDMALLPLDYSFRLSGSGVYPWPKVRGQHDHSWGTTAQGVYRLGDQVEFKIYVRAQSNRHWVAPQRKGYRLAVKDPQNKVIFESNDLVLSEFGALQGEFPIPQQGAVGWYRFELEREDGVADQKQRLRWTPMTILVSDFTPSPFKVNTGTNGQLFKAGDTLSVDTQATLHSGGPFGGAPVRVFARIDNQRFSPSQPQLQEFDFGRIDQSVDHRQQILLDARDSLNAQGEYQHSVSIPEVDIYYGQISVESSVQDDRGKNVANSASARYAGRDSFIGLRNTRWIYQQGKQASIEFVVTDPEGHSLVGIPVSISIQVRQFKASRVKGPGNAYLTRNIAEWVEQSQCQKVSGPDPVTCEFTPSKPGYYQFIASLKDSQGREQITSIDGWVSGSGNVLWSQSNDATLQIVPEQVEVDVGDTARYLVKNPYPGATALISVERYGVLDSWVQTLDTSTPIIEVPVKPDYLPGFYLSVMVVSPRVEQPLGAGKVDLGKPAYRLGYAATEVKDRYKSLAIAVETDKAIYKPRETVTANIHVKLPYKQVSSDLSDHPLEPVELAVAVVDESVLAFNSLGANYYDPYVGFNRLEALDLQNFSLISRLVGRQKFEKKGANPGGDGGGFAASMRDLFKYVSYWNPTVIPDKEGHASIEFTVPDNLTGWRLLVLGVTPSDRMGLGQHNIKVNRATELRSVMPNQVTEGDQFQAGFSLMNRTDKARQLTIDLELSGPLVEARSASHRKTVQLGPYQRKTLYFPVATSGAGELKWMVTAQDQMDSDAIEHRLVVNKRRSLQVAATYGTTDAAQAAENIAIPAGIFTDVGSLSAILSPSVIGNIDGAFRYVRNYPYQCWEQRLTKAVMANAWLQLKEYARSGISWEDADELIPVTIASAANFQAPNGGMSYWAPKNQQVSPYLSAYTAMALQWLRRDGHAIPDSLEDRLHDYLQRMLKEDVFPGFYRKGMASTVRAVALAALARAGKASKADIDRYRSHFRQMDLFGKAHYLQAAILTESDADNRQNALQNILSHASQSGGKFQFNEVWDDRFKILLATPLRSNCGVLSSLVMAEQNNALDSAAGIPFKLVRSVTQSRGQRDHWENTQENVFCANALIEFSQYYEKTSPDFTVTVSLDEKSVGKEVEGMEELGEASFNEKSAPAVTLSRPLREGDEGQIKVMKIAKDGPGRLYYSAKLAYGLKDDQAGRVNSGIEIRREYSVEREGKLELLSSPIKLHKGELVKVDLFVSIPTARHFVVVDDPVPGGLEPVNTQLATTSVVDAEKARLNAAMGSWYHQISDWSVFGRYSGSFYHRELRHDSARFFADYLPAGNYYLSYTAQAIAPGEFSVLPVHSEEMYDPDVYGKGVPARLIVTKAIPADSAAQNKSKTASVQSQQSLASKSKY